MKANIKKRWIKALRSGKYKQGQSALNGKDGFCCLGVACDIFQKEAGGHWDEEKEFVSNSNEADSSGEWLPNFMVNFMGINTEQGELKKSYIKRNGTTMDNLGELNDGGKTFKQIANIIQNNF